MKATVRNGNGDISKCDHAWGSFQSSPSLCSPSSTVLLQDVTNLCAWLRNQAGNLCCIRVTSANYTSGALLARACAPCSVRTILQT